MGEEIHVESVAVTTTGEAGSASGSADSVVLHGYLLDVYLDYHASAPGATTDVTITYKDRGDTILAVANNATDGRYAPRQKPVDNANAAITNAHDRFPLNGKLTVAVAQSDALTACVTAHIRYARIRS